MEEVIGIREKFPTKVPVIVERYQRERYLPLLDKTKFLVPQELTMTQFITIIRKKTEKQGHRTPQHVLVLWRYDNRAVMDRINHEAAGLEAQACKCHGKGQGHELQGPVCGTHPILLKEQNLALR
uniref:Uncharacterized protein n=1 Tax=Sphaerodactylus townsendi TaxID=933632 RepID=A0ACB8GB55_9SAUR